jgi:hypothetical protein
VKSRGVPVRGKLFWRLQRHFGLAAAISVSGATCELPGKGGLARIAINLTYS